MYRLNTVWHRLWTLRTITRSRPETGCSHLIESFRKTFFPEEQMTAFRRRVHGKVRLREPALYRPWFARSIDRKHMHRFSTYQRAGWKDRPQSGGYPGTEHLPWNGSKVRASSHIRRTRWAGAFESAKSGLSERRRESTGKAYRPNLAGMLQLSLACRIWHSSEPV